MSSFRPRLSATIPQHLGSPVSDSSIIIKSSLSSLLQASLSLGEASYQETPDILAILPTTDFHRNLLSPYQLFPSFSDSDRGTSVIHSKIKGQYWENNYRTIITDQAAKGNILIAGDKDWIIPAIATFISDHSGIPPDDNPSEKAAILNIRKVTDINISTKLTPDMITIISLTDTSIPDTTTSIINYQYHLLFAPVTSIEAERIYLYIYRDVKLYSFFNYLAVKGWSGTESWELQKFFPLVTNSFLDFTIFKSSILTREELIQIVYFSRIPVPFSRLDPIGGCYASYLLAEATEYQYDLWWEDRTLYLQGCGYIQSLDLREIFGDLIKQIYQEGIIFRSVSKSDLDKFVSKGIKGFFYMGSWYGAFPILPPNLPVPIINYDQEFSEIELASPLRAITFPHLRSAGLALLGQLGYSIPPRSRMGNWPLEYTTYSIPGGDLLTTYYYLSSINFPLTVCKIKGPNNPLVRDLVTQLLHRGYFFPPFTKTLLKNYPNYMPSFLPLNTDLPHTTDLLIPRLQEILTSLQEK